MRGQNGKTLDWLKTGGRYAEIGSSRYCLIQRSLSSEGTRKLKCSSSNNPIQSWKLDGNYIVDEFKASSTKIRPVPFSTISITIFPFFPMLYAVMIYISWAMLSFSLPGSYFQDGLSVLTIHILVPTPLKIQDFMTPIHMYIRNPISTMFHVSISICNIHDPIQMYLDTKIL